MNLPEPHWVKPLKSYALEVLERLGRDGWDLSVVLCDDKAMSQLNGQYRGKEGATDVLSFALDEGDQFPPGDGRKGRGRRLPGDIVISLDTLRENARRFKVGEDEELRRLLIHGILHLDGMDHRGNGKAEPMLQLQEKILASVSGRHILGRSE
ncbi:MAG: rRNA maturation RNase YbeY [Treponema sp.]|jgi:probable rRNA maturation factor|nr:rRNA maturation RNase YbeY [Treponema sp.]